MPTDRKKPTTKLWIYTQHIFNYMAEKAEPAQIEGNSVLVWEGFMTSVFTELKIPSNYYSIITRILRVMGAADCIERGGGRGRKPSKWALWKAPREEDFERAKAEVMNRKSSKLDPLERKIDDLISAFPKFDIAKALNTAEKRMNRMERRIGRLEEEIETLKGEQDV